MRPTTDVPSANLMMWLHFNIGVFIFQVGEDQVEGGGNYIICRAVWAVCKLERIECVGEAVFNIVHD